MLHRTSSGAWLDYSILVNEELRRPYRPQLLADSLSAVGCSITPCFKTKRPASATQTLAGLEFLNAMQTYKNPANSTGSLPSSQQPLHKPSPNGGLEKRFESLLARKVKREKQLSLILNGAGTPAPEIERRKKELAALKEEIDTLFEMWNCHKALAREFEDQMARLHSGLSRATDCIDFWKEEYHNATTQNEAVLSIALAHLERRLHRAQ